MKLRRSRGRQHILVDRSAFAERAAEYELVDDQGVVRATIKRDGVSRYMSRDDWHVRSFDARGVKRWDAYRKLLSEAKTEAAKLVEKIDGEGNHTMNTITMRYTANEAFGPGGPYIVNLNDVVMFLDRGLDALVIGRVHDIRAESPEGPYERRTLEVVSLVTGDKTYHQVANIQGDVTLIVGTVL